MNFIPVTILFLLLPALMLAQSGSSDSRQPQPSTIRVQGESVVQAKPDRAQIDISVLTQSADPQAAASQNAAKADRIIEQLRQVGQNLEIKTIGYSLNPNYTYPREGGEPKISGYTATNTVQVQTDDLSQAGKIIDTAVKAGANQVQSLRFMLKDETEVQTQALREAAGKARKKADALAAALGVKILRILQVEEGGGGAVPFQTRAFGAEMAKMDTQTPIEPDTIEVNGIVTLTVEVQ
jgi:uncharacterized protein YggE